MKFDSREIGEFFSLQKGFSYTGENLVESSDVGFITLNSFLRGGGYKPGSEKPLGGAIPERFFLSDGDVCIAMTDISDEILGSPLLIDFTRTHYRSLVYSHHVAKLVQKKEGLLPRFLYNILRIDAFRRRASYGDTGTTVLDLPYTALLEFEVPVPPLETQVAISELVRGFDSLIDLNNVLSSQLTEFSRSLFTSWFIDFDPVKAKMAGESPVGMDAETAALFPDSMEESELGEIPRGWRVSNIGSSVQLAGGATPSTKNPEFWDGEYSWLTPKDLSGRRQKIAPTSSRKITLQGLERISSGLLEKGTVLLSSRAPIGYTAICATETAINQGFIALKADELFPPMYLLNWIESNMQEVLNRAGGATFAEVSKAAFRDIPFLCPDAAILRCYRDVTAPIVGQLELLETQNRSLAELRDGLLPRLISGELEIPEEMLAA